jgi:hypothetical protein
MSWIAIWLLASALSFVVLSLLAFFAPEGYQDERGFHYGKPEDTADES